MFKYKDLIVDCVQDEIGEVISQFKSFEEVLDYNEDFEITSVSDRSYILYKAIESELLYASPINHLRLYCSIDNISFKMN